MPRPKKKSEKVFGKNRTLTKDWLQGSIKRKRTPKGVVKCDSKNTKGTKNRHGHQGKKREASAGAFPKSSKKRSRGYLRNEWTCASLPGGRGRSGERETLKRAEGGEGGWRGVSKVFSHDGNLCNGGVPKGKLLTFVPKGEDPARGKMVKIDQGHLLWEALHGRWELGVCVFSFINGRGQERGGLPSHRRSFSLSATKQKNIIIK